MPGIKCQEETRERKAESKNWDSDKMKRQDSYSSRKKGKSKTEKVRTRAQHSISIVLKKNEMLKQA